MSARGAYQVDWSVEVAGRDISDSVVEIQVNHVKDGVDNAKIVLDRSERDFRISKDEQVVVRLTDNDTGTGYRGAIDAVKTDREDPILRLDTRHPAGTLDDLSAVGTVEGGTVFDAVDELITGQPNVPGITFSPGNYDQYENSLQFDVTLAKLYPYVNPEAGGNYLKIDTATSIETAPDGVIPAVHFLEPEDYLNATGQTYTVVLNGRDGNGANVTAEFKLETGVDANAIYGPGGGGFAIPVEGGNGRIAEVTSITTDLPDPADADNLPGRLVTGGIAIRAWQKNSWSWNAGSDTSVRDAIEQMLAYISTQDPRNDWDYRVSAPTNGTPELRLSPGTTDEQATYVMTEGVDVRQPVADVSVDGIYNYVKVNGRDDVNAWAWAYDGDWYVDAVDPIDSGAYPDSPQFGSIFRSPGGVNDVDDIGLRAIQIQAPSASNPFVAGDLAELALSEYYRSPISGTSTVPGIHQADPGDKAEIYYPSRGIPGRTVDNVFEIKTVEYTVSDRVAETKIDWGLPEPVLADMVKSAGSGGLGAATRDDVKQSVQSKVNVQEQLEAESNIVVGTLQSQNDDGTWTVDGRDGVTYDDVEII